MYRDHPSSGARGDLADFPTMKGQSHDGISIRSMQNKTITRACPSARMGAAMAKLRERATGF